MIVPVLSAILLSNCDDTEKLKLDAIDAVVRFSRTHRIDESFEPRKLKATVPPFADYVEVSCPGTFAWVGSKSKKIKKFMGRPTDGKAPTTFGPITNLDVAAIQSCRVKLSIPGSWPVNPEWSWTSNSGSTCLCFEQRASLPVVPTNNKVLVVYDSKGSVTEYSLVDTIELPRVFTGDIGRDDAILLAGFFVEPAVELLSAPPFDAKKCFAVPARSVGTLCDTKLVARSGWKVQFEPDLPTDLIGKAEQHGVVIDAQDGTLLARFGL